MYYHRDPYDHHDHRDHHDPYDHDHCISKYQDKNIDTKERTVKTEHWGCFVIITIINYEDHLTNTEGSTDGLIPLLGWRLLLLPAATHLAQPQVFKFCLLDAAIPQQFRRFHELAPLLLLELKEAWFQFGKELELRSVSRLRSQQRCIPIFQILLPVLLLVGSFH